MSASQRSSPGAWNQIPRPIRRLYVCAIAGLLIGILPDLVNALDGLEVISLSASEELLIKRIKWYLIVPALALLYTWWIASHVRFVRRLRALEYRVCPRCAYSLVGLPDEHTCPECGIEYSVESLRAQWKRWLDAPWRWRRQSDAP